MVLMEKGTYTLKELDVISDGYGAWQVFDLGTIYCKLMNIHTGYISESPICIITKCYDLYYREEQEEILFKAKEENMQEPPCKCTGPIGLHDNQCEYYRWNRRRLCGLELL